MEPIEVAKKFEGLQLKNAEGIAHAHSWEIRVIREDGEDFEYTADFKLRRVNVAVENGVITEVLFIG